MRPVRLPFLATALRGGRPDVTFGVGRAVLPTVPGSFPMRSP